MTQPAQRPDEVAERVQAHVRQHGPITGAATSPDRQMTVTVAPGGALQNITMDPSTSLVNMGNLAEQIVQLCNKATLRASNNLHQAMSGILDQQGLQGLDDIGLTTTPEHQIQASHIPVSLPDPTDAMDANAFAELQPPTSTAAAEALSAHTSAGNSTASTAAESGQRTAGSRFEDDDEDDMEQQGWME